MSAEDYIKFSLFPRQISQKLYIIFYNFLLHAPISCRHVLQRKLPIRRSYHDQNNSTATHRGNNLKMNPSHKNHTKITCLIITKEQSYFRISNKDPQNNLTPESQLTIISTYTQSYKQKSFLGIIEKSQHNQSKVVEFYTQHNSSKKLCYAGRALCIKDKKEVVDMPLAQI